MFSGELLYIQFREYIHSPLDRSKPASLWEVDSLDPSAGTRLDERGGSSRGGEK